MTLPRALTAILMLSLASAALWAWWGHQSQPQPRGPDPVTPEVVVEGLTHPWGMAFLPNGEVLISERPGRLRRVVEGQLLPQPVAGLPQIAAVGQGGALDVAIHPDYGENGWIYLAYVAGADDEVGTEVLRGRLQGEGLTDVEVLFRMRPKSDGGRHFGARLVLDRQNYLYITLGDRGDRPRAQRLDDHAGTVIRLHDDGRIPDDNPFLDDPNALPEIYSYGHRNQQGAALHPESGRLWTHEHGPQGGDELNLIKPGANYGWPVISFGVNYGIGTQIGEGSAKEGMEQPLHYWDPSIAPSGMAFYTGDRYPGWKGDLFIGALKFQLLVRLQLDGTKVLSEQQMLHRKLGRIRDVEQGPDGYLYLLTDQDDGKLVRLLPNE
jgi:glucose/arabinose dehydrogenase